MYTHKINDYLEWSLKTWYKTLSLPHRAGPTSCPIEWIYGGSTAVSLNEWEFHCSFRSKTHSGTLWPVEISLSSSKGNNSSTARDMVNQPIFPFNNIFACELYSHCINMCLAKQGINFFSKLARNFPYMFLQSEEKKEIVKWKSLFSPGNVIFLRKALFFLP